jgi:hypothetical protein
VEFIERGKERGFPNCCYKLLQTSGGHCSGGGVQEGGEVDPMMEKVVREVVRHGHSSGGGGQGGYGMDPTVEELEQRRRLRSVVVVVVEPSPYSGAVVMVGKTRRRQCGPSDEGDDRADGEVVTWT